VGTIIQHHQCVDAVDVAGQRRHQLEGLDVPHLPRPGGLSAGWGGVLVHGRTLMVRSDEAEKRRLPWTASAYTRPAWALIERMHAVSAPLMSHALMVESADPEKTRREGACVTNDHTEYWWPTSVRCTADVVKSHTCTKAP
jgi:hypothetical protein